MSEDQDRNKQEEHWRELAQLLGIGPEAPASKSVQAQAKAPPPVEAEAPPPPLPEPECIATPVAETHEAVIPAPVAEEASVEEPVLPDGLVAQQAEVRSDWRETEERPRRGKRQRGRREEFPPSHMEEETSDLEADEELPEDSENAEEETEDVTEPVDAQTEEDLDVDDTFRDWNVPSWNELIASLYRPDR
jgi:hypothetical protein